MHRYRTDAAWLGTARCRNCAIRDLVLFGDLRDPDFGLIQLPIDELRIEPGAALYHVGEDGGSLYTIRSGLVKLVQFLPDGTQRIVRLLRRGAVAGLEVLVGRPYEHTAVVLQEAEVCQLPRAVVERLSKETPRLHARLMERWYQSLHQADDWLTALSTGSARRRLARLFLKLAADCPGEPVRLSGREDLGAMLGLGMETASRTIAEFKRAGLVRETMPNVFVCDGPALEAVDREG
ncbi:Crp/Fnr family transcriptional regulator [Azospirillum agricola]|uniref:Crp/Fnr family transcriptional regulator n=1 Tax=Azospirillum agricola TaxID=1720247 RepID=UPI000A0F3765|nr:Crp/Fnr family transcriptional regulator [Azospirillum agricola]SMH47910.1 cAMP-binding domain of CRP or a regulatory subunit of cAMP-dependent protein kinases [Azospirillum lipoferum]